MEEPYGVSDAESTGGAGTRYSLVGPQVEPEAAYWTFSGVRFEVIDVDDLPASTLPVFRSDAQSLEYDFFELERLQAQRANGPIAGEDKHPDDEQDRTRLPLSRFFSLNPPPLSAIFNVEHGREVTNVFTQCEPGSETVRTGGELARLFEDETPGLVHRHALNCLLFQSRVSAPRQARIWAALDIAIYSALLAAWRFKWAVEHPSGAPDYRRSYVERPAEYAARTGKNQFAVLYDRQVQEDGSGSQRSLRCPEPDKPEGPQNAQLPSPGTPRHPAYPSGHSTYSAAASEILTYFFPHERVELERLADNIGTARLWAGVHWRQDHLAGRTLGIAVAQRVIAQLRRDPVSPIPQPLPMPCDGTVMPDGFEKLRTAAQRMRNAGGTPGQDVIPPPDQSVQQIQGPNRGAT